MEKKEELKQKVKEIEKRLHCNCDLDKWQPTISTGHSEVCRIHQAATGVGV